MLEIGSGYGVTTRWLLERSGRVTAVEIDPDLAAGLRRTFSDRVDVRTADGAALPFSDATFDAVVCFTVLHHVPTPEQQDRLFIEASRVLRPGGTFAGADGLPSSMFRLMARRSHHGRRRPGDVARPVARRRLGRCAFGYPPTPALTPFR